MKIMINGNEKKLTILDHATTRHLNEVLPTGLDFIWKEHYFSGMFPQKLDVSGVTRTSTLKSNALYYDPIYEQCYITIERCDIRPRRAALLGSFEDGLDDVKNLDKFYVYMDRDQ